MSANLDTREMKHYTRNHITTYNPEYENWTQRGRRPRGAGIIRENLNLDPNK